VSWVSTSAPVIPLEPGENKEVTLLVRPPLSPSSQAGRYKFNILVASQKTPDQIVKVDCIMTVAAYTQFSAELEPKEVTAGQPVRVSVKNEGNIQQVFHLACVSQNDQLLFEYLQPEGVKQLVKQASPESSAQQNKNASAGSQQGAALNPQSQSPQAAAGEQISDPTVLPIPLGESAAFRFTARPCQRPLIGGVVSYPYHVSVKSRQQEAPTLPGKVIGHGVIPVWVLPIVLLLCLSVFFASIFLSRRGAQSNSATQTSEAETTLAVGCNPNNRCQPDGCSHREPVRYGWRRLD
jgi:hypothetical protein